MTSAEYKEIREKQIEAMEAHLKDIIGIYIDNTEKGTPAYEENMPKYRKLLDNPVLMRKATEVFDEEFWGNDDVVNLEHQAAQTAIDRVASEPEETEPENGFAIIRDGEKIYLTDEELRAVRRRDTYNYLRKELNYWMTGLLDSHDEEYKEIDRFVRDKKNVDSLFAMLHAEFVECLYPEFAKLDRDNYYQAIDSLFRTRIRKMMGKEEA